MNSGDLQIQHILLPLGVGFAAGWGIHYLLKEQKTNKPQEIDSSSALPFEFTDHVRDGFTGAIGGSPLIYLRSLSEETGRHIFVCRYDQGSQQNLIFSLFSTRVKQNL